MSHGDATKTRLHVNRTWHTSTYTNDRGACVEVSEGPATGVRDSKRREEEALYFAAPEWQAFVTAVRQSEL